MGAESELAARSVCDSSLCKPVSEMAENAKSCHACVRISSWGSITEPKALLYKVTNHDHHEAHTCVSLVSARRLVTHMHFHRKCALTLLQLEVHRILLSQPNLLSEAGDLMAHHRRERGGLNFLRSFRRLRRLLLHYCCLFRRR